MTDYKPMIDFLNKNSNYSYFKSDNQAGIDKEFKNPDSIYSQQSKEFYDRLNTNSTIYKSAISPYDKDNDGILDVSEASQVATALSENKIEDESTKTLLENSACFVTNVVLENQNKVLKQDNVDAINERIAKLNPGQNVKQVSFRPGENGTKIEEVTPNSRNQDKMVKDAKTIKERVFTLKDNSQKNQIITDYFSSLSNQDKAEFMNVYGNKYGKDSKYPNLELIENVKELQKGDDIVSEYLQDAIPYNPNVAADTIMDASKGFFVNDRKTIKRVIDGSTLEQLSATDDVLQEKYDDKLEKIVKREFIFSSDRKILLKKVNDANITDIRNDLGLKADVE